MILFNNQLQTEIHPRHAMLHRKYRDLAIRLSADRTDFLPTAATFVPSAGKGIAFERPIAPVGSALLCTLGHDADPADNECFNGFYFRGYRGRYLNPSGETIWEPQDWFNFPVSAHTYASVHDDRLMRSPRFLDTLIGLGLLAQRVSDLEPMDRWRLMLPPTLYGFALDQVDLIDQVSAMPTRWVRNHARTYGLTNEQAWHELDGATRVDGDTEMTGLRLIDARLCADVETGARHLPVVLSAFHDFRLLLGRRCSNPVRKLAGDELSEIIGLADSLHGHQRASQLLRRLTPREIADGCTDDDLWSAIRDPEGPLVASRIAKRQAW